MNNHRINVWKAPAPWVNYLAQCTVLDYHDGKVATCEHDPQPVFAGALRDDSPPVVYDANDRILRCLACFTEAWARRKPAPTMIRCIRCTGPGSPFRAPTVGYPNLFITVTACTVHGPGGKDW